VSGAACTLDVGTAPADAVARQVWERLWRQRPSAQKDDVLLAREAGGPRFRSIVNRLEETFGAVGGLQTIELGSGRGDLSALLARLGAEVTLLDRSEAALEEARWRFQRIGMRATYVADDITGSMSAWRGKFDVALSLGVAEHFRGDDRTRVIRAHHDVLRPGGLAVISVPNARCLPYRLWKSYLEMRKWWPYGMELPYTVTELARRAKRAGFDRAETHCIGFWQSIGDYWGQTLLRRKIDLWNRTSWLDGWMGAILLLFAWREPGIAVEQHHEAGVAAGGVVTSGIGTDVDRPVS